MPKRIDDENLDLHEKSEDFLANEGENTASFTVIAALEQIVILMEEARAVPLSANVIVNKAEVIDLVEQAREALPEDLRAADAVVADADAVLDRADSAAEVTIAEANAKAKILVEDAREKADLILSEAKEEAERRTSRAKEEAEVTIARAHSEAERTLTEARQNAENILAEHTLTTMAQERAQKIVSDAKVQAGDLTSGADRYVVDSLTNLAQTLREMLRTTDGGLRKVENRAGLGRASIDMDLND